MTQPLDAQVAALTKAVTSLTTIVSAYALPAVVDADVDGVRRRLARIHADLSERG